MGKWKNSWLSKEPDWQPDQSEQYVTGGSSCEPSSFKLVLDKGKFMKTDVPIAKFNLSSLLPVNFAIVLSL